MAYNPCVDVKMSLGEDLIWWKGEGKVMPPFPYQNIPFLTPQPSPADDFITLSCPTFCMALTLRGNFRVGGVEGEMGGGNGGLFLSRYFVWWGAAEVWGALCAQILKASILATAKLFYILSGVIAEMEDPPEGGKGGCGCRRKTRDSREKDGEPSSPRIQRTVLYFKWPKTKRWGKWRFLRRAFPFSGIFEGGVYRCRSFLIPPSFLNFSLDFPRYLMDSRFCERGGIFSGCGVLFMDSWMRGWGILSFPNICLHILGSFIRVIFRKLKVLSA